MLNEKQKEQLRKIGIYSLENITKQDIVKVVVAYLKKNIDMNTLEYFIDNVNLSDILDAIKTLSKDNAEVEKKVLEVILEVVKGLNENLSSAETEDERQKIRYDLMECLKAASGMSRRQFKKYMKTLGLIAGGIGLIGLLVLFSGNDNRGIDKRSYDDDIADSYEL